jgi:hypothetical protein
VRGPVLKPNIGIFGCKFEAVLPTAEKHSCRGGSSMRRCSVRGCSLEWLSRVCVAHRANGCATVRV